MEKYFKLILILYNIKSIETNPNIDDISWLKIFELNICSKKELVISFKKILNKEKLLSKI